MMSRSATYLALLLLAAGCSAPPADQPAPVALYEHPDGEAPRLLGAMSIPPTTYYDGSGGRIGAAFRVQFPSGWTGALSAGMLTLSGGGATFPLYATNGTALAPSLSFASQPTMGMYVGGTNILGLTSGTGSLLISNGTGGSALTVGNIVAHRTGGNIATVQVYSGNDLADVVLVSSNGGGGASLQLNDSAGNVDLSVSRIGLHVFGINGVATGTYVYFNLANGSIYSTDHFLSLGAVNAALASVTSATYVSDGTDCIDKEFIVADTGGTTAGKVVVWSGAGKVQNAGATLSLTTIAGVATTTTAAAGTATVCRSGRATVNTTDANCTAGALASTSSSTAGSVQCTIAVGLGAGVGRISTAQSGSTATVDVRLF